MGKRNDDDQDIEQDVEQNWKDHRVYQLNSNGGEIHIHVYDCNKVYVNSGQPPPPVNPPGGKG